MRAKIIEAFSDPWVLFGFGAQFLFFLRFFIQWVASERRGKSYIPVVFWWFSLSGGLTLLIYAVHRTDPVFIAGQGLGCLIYIRNLVLIYRRQRRVRARKRSAFDVLMSDGLANGRDQASNDLRAPGEDKATPPAGRAADLSPPLPGIEQSATHVAE
jgi:lipid-A-disaccharide synthase-like uncharacterized protein